MRKRSIGIILFSLFFVTLEGFLALFPPEPVIPLFIHNTVHFIFGVIGIFLFLTKNWARKLAMILYPCFSLFGLIYTWRSGLQRIIDQTMLQYPEVSVEAIKMIYPGLSVFSHLLFPALTIYFFTRPKVKEQFQSQKTNV